jgi:hypothetical protein
VISILTDLAVFNAGLDGRSLLPPSPWSTR